MTETEAGRNTGSHAAGSRGGGKPAHAADDRRSRVNGVAATALADLPDGVSQQRSSSLDSTTILPRISADGPMPTVVHEPAPHVAAPRGGGSAVTDLPARLRGTTAIAGDVLEKVAGFAAEQVDGVFDLGGDVARAINTIKERLGIGEGTSRRGVHVEQSGRQVRITLTLVVQFGHPAMQVAEQVRENVIAAVETMMAMDVTECNVIIDDIHVED
ncbi:MAG: Asp23/Gls24 family envelope stress response protein [Actinocatenispora sp.]